MKLARYFTHLKEIIIHQSSMELGSTIQIAFEWRSMMEIHLWARGRFIRSTGDIYPNLRSTGDIYPNLRSTGDIYPDLRLTGQIKRLL
jgi:hypothetical protein